MFKTLILLAFLGFAVYKIVSKTKEMAEEREASIRIRDQKWERDANQLKNAVSKEHFREFFDFQPEKKTAHSSNKFLESLSSSEYLIEAMVENLTLESNNFPTAQRAEKLRWIKAQGAKGLSSIRESREFYELYRRDGILWAEKSRMIRKEYGVCNTAFWNSVNKLDQTEAVRFVTQCETDIAQYRFTKMTSASAEKLLMCIWFFAINNSALYFGRAQKVFYSYYKFYQPDIIFAKLYIEKDAGYNNASYAYAEELCTDKYGIDLSLIASACKWMKAYRAELRVLQHMKDNKLEMTNQMKERYHALTHDFTAFTKNTPLPDYCMMLGEQNYGKVNKSFWDSVLKMTRADALRIVNESKKESVHLDQFGTVNLEMLIKCVWFFALEKPFSSNDFTAAKLTLNEYSRTENDANFSWITDTYRTVIIDAYIAEMYSKKNIGGEDALQEYIRQVLKEIEDKSYRYYNARSLLREMASALMWLNAYRSEKTILQYMLNKGHEMSPQMQARLHALANGGGNAPQGHDAVSTGNTLYFDVSALAWKDEDYVGLFENLSFQEKKLTYALAVRTEDKGLLVAQGVKTPSESAVMSRLRSVFGEEYGSIVTPAVMQCTALSGSGKEQMSGILVVSRECKPLGLLVHLAQIGRTFNVKFYTLYMPNGNDLSGQKQEALSLYNNLSPSVAMWESSLKDTVLMVIQQLLNAPASPATEVSKKVATPKKTATPMKAAPVSKEPEKTGDEFYF